MSITDKRRRKKQKRKAERRSGLTLLDNDGKFLLYTDMILQ